MGSVCGGSSTGQTTTSTSSPPPQTLADYQGLITRGAGVANTPYTPYGGEQVAPLSNQTVAGLGNLNQYAYGAQPYLTQAGQMTQGAAAPVTPMSYSGSAIGQFLNPFTADVINATQAEFNNQNQQQAQFLNSQNMGAGAFGGDRAGVSQGVLAGQQQTAQAPVIAGLNQQNYSQALAEFNNQQQTALGAQEFNRQQLGQMAAQYGNIGTGLQGAGIQGAGAQIQGGMVPQAEQQAIDTALQNQWTSGQAYPFQTTGFLGNLIEGLGGQTGGTASTTAPGPSPFSQLLGAGVAGTGIAANLFGSQPGGTSAASGIGSFLSGLPFISDVRAKENITPVGKTFDGQTIHRFNYKGDPRTQIGLLAQEVEKRHPGAVGEGLGGLKMVDYDAATRESERAGFQSGGAPSPAVQGTVGTMGLGKFSPAGALRMLGVQEPGTYGGLMGQTSLMYTPAGHLFGGGQSGVSIPGGGPSPTNPMPALSQQPASPFTPRSAGLMLRPTPGQVQPSQAQGGRISFQGGGGLGSVQMAGIPNTPFVDFATPIAIAQGTGVPDPASGIANIEFSNATGTNSGKGSANSQVIGYTGLSPSQPNLAGAAPGTVFRPIDYQNPGGDFQTAGAEASLGPHYFTRGPSGELVFGGQGTGPPSAINQGELLARPGGSLPTDTPKTENQPPPALAPAPAPAAAPAPAPAGPTAQDLRNAAIAQALAAYAPAPQQGPHIWGGPGGAGGGGGGGQWTGGRIGRQGGGGLGGLLGNPPFTTVQYDAGGGSRGPRSAPIYTAANFDRTPAPSTPPIAPPITAPLPPPRPRATPHHIVPRAPLPPPRPTDFTPPEQPRSQVFPPWSTPGVSPQDQPHRPYSPTPIDPQGIGAPQPRFTAKSPLARPAPIPTLEPMPWEGAPSPEGLGQFFGRLPGRIFAGTPIGRAANIGRGILEPSATAGPTGIELRRSLGRAPSGPAPQRPDTGPTIYAPPPSSHAIDLGTWEGEGGAPAPSFPRGPRWGGPPPADTDPALMGMGDEGPQRRSGGGVGFLDRPGFWNSGGVMGQWPLAGATGYTPQGQGITGFDSQGAGQGLGQVAKSAGGGFGDLFDGSKSAREGFQIGGWAASEPVIQPIPYDILKGVTPLTTRGKGPPQPVSAKQQDQSGSDLGKAGTDLSKSLNILFAKPAPSGGLGFGQTGAGLAAQYADPAASDISNLNVDLGGADDAGFGLGGVVRRGFQDGGGDDGVSTTASPGAVGWGAPSASPGQATAAGYGFGSGIGGPGSAAEAASFGGSTTGTGSFGYGMGGQSSPMGTSVTAGNQGWGGQSVGPGGTTGTGYGGIGVGGIGAGVGTAPGGGVSTAGVTGGGGGTASGGSASGPGGVIGQIAGAPYGVTSPSMAAYLALSPQQRRNVFYGPQGTNPAVQNPLTAASLMGVPPGYATGVPTATSPVSVSSLGPPGAGAPSPGLSPAMVAAINAEMAQYAASKGTTLAAMGYSPSNAGFNANPTGAENVSTAGLGGLGTPNAPTTIANPGGGGAPSGRGGTGAPSAGIGSPGYNPAQAIATAAANATAATTPWSPPAGRFGLGGVVRPGFLEGGPGPPDPPEPPEPLAEAPAPAPASAAPAASAISAAAAPAGKPTREQVLAYNASRASKYGLDPNVVTGVLSHEMGAKDPYQAGDVGSSFGPWQLHKGGISETAPNPGMGDEYAKATGHDPNDPRYWQEQSDFALSGMAKQGLTPWATTMGKLGLNRWSAGGEPSGGALAFTGGTEQNQQQQTQYNAAIDDAARPPDRKLLPPGLGDTLIMMGAGMMAGTSPHAMVNIGKGIQEGMQYAQNQRQLDREWQKNEAQIQDYQSQARYRDAQTALQTQQLQIERAQAANGIAYSNWIVGGMVGSPPKLEIPWLQSSGGGGGTVAPAPISTTPAPAPAASGKPGGAPPVVAAPATPPATATPPSAAPEATSGPDETVAPDLSKDPDYQKGRRLIMQGNALAGSKFTEAQGKALIAQGEGLVEQAKSKFETAKAPYTAKIEAQKAGYQEYQKSAQDFNRDYESNTQMLSELSKIYKGYRSGTGAQDIADIQGFADRFGLGGLLPEGWNKAGYDAALKTAVDAAFQKMRDSGANKAPRTALQEALLTSPTPTNDPAANWKIITETQARLHYAKDMMDGVLSSDQLNVPRAESEWAKSPHNKLDRYRTEARKSTPLFMGMTPGKYHQVTGANLEQAKDGRVFDRETGKVWGAQGNPLN